MAITTVSKNMAIIAALADLPNATDGLTAAQLKTKFDEGGEALKTYINSTLIPALEAITDGSSGADQIGATEVATGSGTTVQTILEWVYAELVSVVLGQIPNDSLTNAKLGTDIKVGSLASLTTTDKTSVVAAFNEHVAANVTEFQLTRIRSYMEV